MQTRRFTSKAYRSPMIESTGNFFQRITRRSIERGRMFCMHYGILAAFLTLALHHAARRDASRTRGEREGRCFWYLKIHARLFACCSIFSPRLSSVGKPHSGVDVGGFRQTFTLKQIDPSSWLTLITSTNFVHGIFDANFLGISQRLFYITLYSNVMCHSKLLEAAPDLI